jgi:cyclophilin family peptidyl-prolyl cis-trans isomerase
MLVIIPGTVLRFTFSGIIGGGPSNVDVQLFDHDKPATVENFLHYVNSGAYSNMFINRGVPGFVIQGGGFASSDRTSAIAPITGTDIGSRTIGASNQPSPPFPQQVANEFGDGPVIHNRYGTLAMALNSRTTNSATTEFFFNTADNSAGLDRQDFTVFGAILNGSNVLQYFNGLTTGGGLVNNAVILDNGVMTTNPFPLPVNYNGNAAPANSNLVIVDFSFPFGQPAADTNPPTVAITSSPAPLIETNSNPTVRGTASDNVGVANITSVAVPLPASDGTVPNLGVAITNFADGATNWLATIGFVQYLSNYGVYFTNPLPPGSYQVTVQAQDGAGNLSASSNIVVERTLVNAVGNGTISYGTNNAVGYPFQGGTYPLVATPASNSVFASWTGPGLVSFDPNFVLLYNSVKAWTATFISNTMPNSLAFTYPPANGYITNQSINITGTISNVPSPPVTLTLQLVASSSSQTIGTIYTNTVTNGFSVPFTNLPLGSYAVEATAVDAAGNTTATSETFTVTTNALFQLNVVGPGTVSGVTNGIPVFAGAPFQAMATPNGAGDLFYKWTYGSMVAVGPVFTNSVRGGVTLTATFISNTLPNSIALTAPLSNVVLTNFSVVVAGTISNVPAPPVALTCQFFSQSNFLAVTPPLTTNGTTNWTFTQQNIGPGKYIAVVLATDQASNTTVIETNFTAILVTNLPTISILSPATNVLIAQNLPVTISGTAADSVLPVNLIVAQLAPLRDADGTSPNGGQSLNVYAMGTSNWTANFGVVPPGVYAVAAEALDSVGNIGIISNGFLTNTGVLINGNGSVILSQGTNVKSDVIGYPLQVGTSYKLQAVPGPGQQLVSWTAGAFISTNPIQTFTMAVGTLFTATFAPSNSAKTISFSYPPANARLSTNSFVIKGRMTPAFDRARIGCRLSSLTTGFNFAPLQAVSATATWSAAVSNLPPDNYVVVAEATNSTGQLATVSERFTVLPFTLVAGTYTGLFISTNTPVSATNSGALTVTVTPTGVMTGKIVFPAYAPVPIYPVGFGNDYFTTGFAQFGLKGFHNDTWNASLALDLSGSNDVVQGTIASAGWSAPVFCYKAVTALTGTTTPAVGKYAFTISDATHTNGPGTNGYAVLSVAKNGTMALAGALPDNSTFSESTHVAAAGYWPICVVPSGEAGKGVLIGWETFTNRTESTGQLYWFKKTGVGLYYTGGVGLLSNALMNVTGTNFVKPAAGSQYSIVFQGGTLTTPLTNSLSVVASGQFSVMGGADDKLKISLAASGLLTGSIYNSSDAKTLRFKGIFIDPAQGGSGFIPDANGEIGTFQLTPVP